MHKMEEEVKYFSTNTDLTGSASVTKKVFAYMPLAITNMRLGNIQSRIKENSVLLRRTNQMDQLSGKSLIYYVHCNTF